MNIITPIIIWSRGRAPGGTLEKITAMDVFVKKNIIF
jgi:hypothetical protein